MTERNLARFRADPTKVRVALRPHRDGWHIDISSRVNDHRFSVAIGSRDQLAIASALMEALMWCYSAKMPGIDPYMDWAYEHPHNENQYYEVGEARREQDNEMMRRLGLDDHVNELH